jgi:hypothetical protein
LLAASSREKEIGKRYKRRCLQQQLEKRFAEKALNWDK